MPKNIIPLNTKKNISLPNVKVFPEKSVKSMVKTVVKKDETEPQPPQPIAEKPKIPKSLHSSRTLSYS